MSDNWKREAETWITGSENWLIDAWIAGTFAVWFAILAVKQALAERRRLGKERQKERDRKMWG